MKKYLLCGLLLIITHSSSARRCKFYGGRLPELRCQERWHAAHRIRINNARDKTDIEKAHMLWDENEKFTQMQMEQHHRTKNPT